MGDIFVHMLSLPCRVHGLTVPDADGNFTIIVNENLNGNVKQQTLRHELEHIKLEHFYNDCKDVAVEELEANLTEG